MSNLWQITIALPPGTEPATLDLCALALEDIVYSISTLNPENNPQPVLTAITGLAMKAEDIRGRIFLTAQIRGVAAPPVADIAVTVLEDEDWLEKVHRDFPPITLGGFYIYGSHYNGPVPDTLIALKIDAATAFGSGEHQTTQGCLGALEKLHTDGFQPENILDMGCGSGILGIAAQKLWPDATVTAVDIDPESAIVTNRHAAMNGCAHIRAADGPGYATPLVADRGPFDLVLANILAKPLIAMAPDLAQHVENGALVVLSGLLVDQITEVSKTHENQGFVLVSETDIEGWATLVLRKTAD